MASRFSVEAIFSALDRMSGPIGKMEKRISKFAGEAKKSLSGIDEVNTRISGGFKMVGAAIATVGAGAAAVGYNVAKTGMDFEQAITNVAAVSLMTRDQVKDLETEALRLGTTTKFSAIQVAEGMELMGKAGFTNTQILKGIGPVLSAAAAEGADFAEVAGLVSNTLKGMGLDVSETARVADVLTLASARTNSSISSLGESMKNVAPIARQFKIPFETAVASVALLQDVGVDASEAGNATATMLTKLATPTKEMSAKMRTLGITFQDAHGDMLPLPDIFANMGKAATKSGGNMKTASFFAELVGLRGQKAALNLNEMFKSGKFEELTSELMNAAGAAQKMADIRMDTFGGDLTKLSNTVDDLKISLFDMNSGPLRGIVKDTTAWITANKELIKTNVGAFAKGITDWASANKDTFKRIGRDIGDGLKWISSNAPTILSWLERFGKAAVYFYTFSAGVKVAKTGVEGVQVALKLAEGGVWAFGKTATVWKWTTGLIGKGAEMLGVFNTSAAAAKTGMEGIQDGLNASKLGASINSITGKLGYYGLAGAALGVGVAFGLWLNDTYKLDEKISGFIAKITGLEDKLNKAGGRAKKPGLDPKGQLHFSDGSIQNPDGTWASKSPERLAKEHQKGLDRAAGMLVENRQKLAMATGTAGDAGDSQPQLITPPMLMAQSITEHTETSKGEITIKDDTKRAEVTQQPKSGAWGIVLQQSGSFP